MPRFRRAFALVACCALAVAGCGSSDDDSAGAKPAKPPAKVAEARTVKPTKTSTPTPEPKTADELKGSIGKIVLTDKEIGHEVEIQNQDDSLTTPTNDICGRKWAGDKKRLARNQDFFWESGKSASLVVSGEAVAYRPGTGSKALAEIERGVSDCDGWKHEQGQIRDVTAVDPRRARSRGRSRGAGSTPATARRTPTSRCTRPRVTCSAPSTSGPVAGRRPGRSPARSSPRSPTGSRTPPTDPGVPARLTRHQGVRASAGRSGRMGR